MLGLGTAGFVFVVCMVLELIIYFVPAPAKPYPPVLVGLLHVATIISFVICLFILLGAPLGR